MSQGGFTFRLLAADGPHDSGLTRLAVKSAFIVLRFGRISSRKLIIIAFNNDKWKVCNILGLQKVIGKSNPEMQ
eukprot:scaffold647846_cov51-Prasinocladus_malaysianus.AAC.1